MTTVFTLVALSGAVAPVSTSSVKNSRVSEGADGISIAGSGHLWLHLRLGWLFTGVPHCDDSPSAAAAAPWPSVLTSGGAVAVSEGADGISRRGWLFTSRRLSAQQKSSCTAPLQKISPRSRTSLCWDESRFFRRQGFYCVSGDRTASDFAIAQRYLACPEPVRPRLAAGDWSDGKDGGCRQRTKFLFSRWCDEPRSGGQEQPPTHFWRVAGRSAAAQQQQQQSRRHHSA